MQGQFGQGAAQIVCEADGVTNRLSEFAAWGALMIFSHFPVRTAEARSGAVCSPPLSVTLSQAGSCG